MMNTLIDLMDAGMSTPTLDIVVADILENNSLDEEDERYLVALAWGRKNDGQDCVGPEDVSLQMGEEVHILDAVYRVLSETEKEEAWEAWEEALESFGEDCVDGYDGLYFDKEAWLRDAKVDGAGHTLATYDGHEQEYCVSRSGGDVWFFLFRTN